MAVIYNVGKKKHQIDQREMTMTEACSSIVKLSPRRLSKYGDILIPVYKGMVLEVFDIGGFQVTETGTQFSLTPSIQYRHLVGQLTEYVWRKGQSMPVKYEETRHMMQPPVNATTVNVSMSVDTDSKVITIHTPEGYTLNQVITVSEGAASD